jgi:hypothetical protein
VKLYGPIRPALADQPVAGTKGLRKLLGSVIIGLPIQLAVRNDEELSKLLGSVLRAIRGAGRFPAGSNGRTPAETGGYQLRGGILSTPRGSVIIGLPIQLAVHNDEELEAARWAGASKAERP